LDIGTSVSSRRSFLRLHSLDLAVQLSAPMAGFAAVESRHPPKAIGKRNRLGAVSSPNGGHFRNKSRAMVQGQDN